MRVTCFLTIRRIESVVSAFCGFDRFGMKYGDVVCVVSCMYRRMILCKSSLCVVGGVARTITSPPSVCVQRWRLGVLLAEAEAVH